MQNQDPPIPTPAEQEGMKRFQVLKALVDKYEPRYGTRMIMDENKSMHQLLQEEGEKPADNFHDVPDEKKASRARGLGEMLAKKAKANASS